MQCWSSANVVVLDMDSSTQVGVDWLHCLVSFPDKTPKLKLVETLKWCASIFGISVPFSRVNYGSKIPSRKLLRCKGSITIKACVRDSRFVWFSKKPGYQGQSHSNPFFFVFFGCVVTGICFFVETSNGTVTDHPRRWYVFLEMKILQLELIWVDHMRGNQVILYLKRAIV